MSTSSDGDIKGTAGDLTSNIFRQTHTKSGKFLEKWKHFHEMKIFLFFREFILHFVPTDSTLQCHINQKQIYEQAEWKPFRSQLPLGSIRSRLAAFGFNNLNFSSNRCRRLTKSEPGRVKVHLARSPAFSELLTLKSFSSSPLQLTVTINVGIVCSSCETDVRLKILPGILCERLGVFPPPEWISRNYERYEILINTRVLGLARWKLDSNSNNGEIFFC